MNEINFKNSNKGRIIFNWLQLQLDLETYSEDEKRIIRNQITKIEANRFEAIKHKSFSNPEEYNVEPRIVKDENGIITKISEYSLFCYFNFIKFSIKEILTKLSNGCDTENTIHLFFTWARKENIYIEKINEVFKNIPNKILNTLSIDKAKRDDCLQEGRMAMISRLHTFDTSRGFRFYTYTKRRIKGSIVDYLKQNATIPEKAKEYIKNNIKVVIEPTNEYEIIEKEIKSKYGKMKSIHRRLFYLIDKSCNSKSIIDVDVHETGKNVSFIEKFSAFMNYACKYSS